MVVASVALVFPDVRLWTVLAVGILVFIVVLFIVSYNRYLWMARIALGGLVLSSWIVKGISAYLQVNDDTFLGFIVNEIGWQDSFNLTICFAVLIGADVFVHHCIPYLRERNRNQSQELATIQNNVVNPQTIKNIKADTVNIDQHSASDSRKLGQVTLPSDALQKLLHDQFSRGQELGKVATECELLRRQVQQEYRPNETSFVSEKATYAEILKSKADMLISQIQDLIDLLEYGAAFSKAQVLEEFVASEKEGLPVESLVDSYVFLANVEITKANWLNITKGKRKNLSRVKHFFEKARNVRRKRS